MKYFVLLFILFLSAPVYSAHLHKEKYYQNLWCNAHNGKQEVILPDRTRIDCLTDKYAIEFDFAQKWAESVGQSLYYAMQTGKKPAIVLILETDKDKIYYNRLVPLCKKYNITLFTTK